MAAWALHGRRRQVRRNTTAQTGPLPIPEERLLFIGVDLKQYPTLPMRPGGWFGMRPAATPWIPVLRLV
jgi:hypothetical protein